MARSTSSEDGSPTVRDLARLPANTGLVNGYGVCVTVFVCVWQCMTHVLSFAISCGTKPKKTCFYYNECLRATRVFVVPHTVSTMHGRQQYMV